MAIGNEEVAPLATTPSGGYRIGYALSPSKVDTVIQPSLLAHAQNRGVNLIPLDLDRPLVDQGPFLVILHKIYSEDWDRELQEYKLKHRPNVIIIDSLASIQRIQNRISMLDVVSNIPPFPQSSSPILTFGIPNQVVIKDANSLSSSQSHPLKFPVIAKPLMADGTENSHQMCLVLNSQALNKANEKVKPPFVLQEFVNHGGILFKVYVAGDHVKCVKRRSLPDIQPDSPVILEAVDGVLPFSQISTLAPPKAEAEEEMPPMEFVHHIAQGLRHALKLHLFNFDMIRDVSLPTKFLIIDVNYFPGYAKLPGFETMLTDFVLDLLNHCDEASATLDEVCDEDNGGQTQLGSYCSYENGKLEEGKEKEAVDFSVSIANH